MSTIKVSVSETIDAPAPDVFAMAMEIDPRELIQRYGPLPGVAAVDGQTAAWSAVGQTRRLTLSDGSHAEEELVSLTPDAEFAYRGCNYTGVFKALVREARGEWHFSRLAAGKTQIDWTYSFAPKGPVEEAVLWFIVKLFWPGYLRAALKRVKTKAENAT